MPMIGWAVVPELGARRDALDSLGGTRDSRGDDDGSEHTGSVHVVNVDSLQTARSFAFAEPYAQAG